MTPGPVPAAKLRGAYPTPEPVARFLSTWAVRDPGAQILEPSAGDGAFVRAASPLLDGSGRIDAVESFAHDAGRVAALGLANVRVAAEDVFAWWDGRARYDAVVGNPPFIRYQAFNGARRQLAFELMARAGLRPSRLTNAWVPFVVLAVRAVRAGGRVGMVVPSELLSVGYAGPLREWLAGELSSLTLVTFRRLVFGPVQQKTVLLMGERGRGPAAVSVAAVGGPEDLDTGVSGAVGAVEAPLPPGGGKWTRLWLSRRQRGLLEDIERSGAFPRLGALASVDVGIVTGANRFFVLRPSEARRRRLGGWCVPLVARSAQLPARRLDEDAWQARAGADDPCLLLDLPARLPAAARAYVEEGERAGVTQGYKCRIRLPAWWRIPSVWAPDAFLLRQIHARPRLVTNPVGAVCTDTIHRVRVRPGTDPEHLAEAVEHPLTWAFAEVLGRSYGGGVLELEPSEAEALPLAPPGGGGLSAREVHDLRGIWEDLSRRRRPRPRP